MSKQETEAKKSAGLLRSSAVVGVMTMLSRVLGLARDVVVANYFGASGSADAFFVAFKIPNFLRRLFAEGAFAQAFVPVLSEYRTQKDLKGSPAACKLCCGYAWQYFNRNHCLGGGGCAHVNRYVCPRFLYGG